VDSSTKYENFLKLLKFGSQIKQVSMKFPIKFSSFLKIKKSKDFPYFLSHFKHIKVLWSGELNKEKRQVINLISFFFA